MMFQKFKDNQLALIEIEGQEGESVSVVGNLQSSASELIGASREGMQAGEKIHRDSERKVKATPVARRLAAKEGIELSTLEGNGPAGRILKEDILSELRSRRPADHLQNPKGSMGGTSAANIPSEPTTLSTLRKTVTRNLEASWKTPAALVHDFAVADDLVDRFGGRTGRTGDRSGGQADLVGDPGTDLRSSKGENWRWGRSCLCPSSLIIGSVTVPMPFVSSTPSSSW